MSNPVKFYKKSEWGQDEVPADGYIWFNPNTGLIGIYKNGDWEYYSGLKDASYVDQKLTIIPCVGDEVEVDLSGISANAAAIQDIGTTVEEIELAVASTLTEFEANYRLINENMAKIRSDIQAIYFNMYENEVITASALNDLNARLGSVFSNVSGNHISIDNVNNQPMINIVTGNVSDGENAIAVASDVKSYVDDSLDWGEY